MYNESGDNMYDFLNGIVDNVYPNGVALDVNGIGFFINTPNPYSFNIGSKEKIYIYQVVREDELSLYGFKTMEERDFFLKLISVKGLGPRMALPILATGSINGISDAIERENYLYLKKFPKIGDKVAKQIVLDLKGKLNDINITNVDNSNDISELHDALISLGYKKKDIKEVISKVDKSLSIGDQIKESLKLLLR